MEELEIEFRTETPVTGETKFGGQPDWVGRPEWPISASTEKPMRFVCQINLKQIGVEDSDAEMAFFFMTEEEDYVDGTWDADGGENAIILQPGRHTDVQTDEIVDGPTIHELVQASDSDKLIDSNCEFSVVFKNLTSADPIRRRLNKVGGHPDFIQFEEYPSDEPWDLLIQLDSCSVPFWINFGDAGVGYGFISPDRTKAKFLWQCA
jgi:uncharacterized protein YwqG